MDTSSENTTSHPPTMPANTAQSSVVIPSEDYVTSMLSAVGTVGHGESTFLPTLYCVQKGDDFQNCHKNPQSL